jgi:RNA polymerase sigma-70 factor (ECF subfamily)
MARDAQLETLLTHADWLRGLAVHLVHGDRQLAGDLVQQTWLAALRSPPDPDRPARPWLAQVLRNFLRRQGKASAARRVRETASEPDPVPSSDALLEAAQSQRLIAELVVNLDEPYRSTTLARYYQGLEPTEIARQLGIPAGTVRWRLKEAIRRLRAELDGRESGWRAALLPLLPSPRGGLMVMGVKAKLSVVSMVVLVVLVGGGALTWRAVEAGRPAGVNRVNRVNRPPAPLPVLTTAGPGERPAPREGRAPRAALPPPRLAPVAGPADQSGRSGGGPKRGQLDKDLLRTAIRAVMPQMKDCYSKLLETEPNAFGRVMIRFVIAEGTGQVQEATILPRQTDGGAPELVAPLAEQCILNALTAASFPVPAGGPVTVSYPIVFAPNDDPASILRAGGHVP